MAASTSTQRVDDIEALPRPGPFPVRSGFLVMSIGEVGICGVGEFVSDHGSGFDGNVAFQYRAPEAEGARVRRDAVKLPCFAGGVIKADCCLGSVFGIGSFMECVTRRRGATDNG